MNTYELARYSATHYLKYAHMQIMGNRKIAVRIDSENTPH
ncbi:hypothetical protein VCHA54P489_110038 [Vibrio chagasii]|nr:hypothetical protein VCHA54P489_110038 [Vibrio chagasii]CAH7076215.1 hypothetical protein VCHA49P380_10038 [Vibrio chagasii]CAH7436462.1 hypothetical protein VCHA37P202_90117 [Vibrio chagasii]